VLNTALKAIFGSRNDRLLKNYRKTVAVINALEPQFEKLTDAELQAKTPELKKRIADGTALNDVLPEAFAVVREASKRVLQMRHFDVQLIGGIALHEGKIAEMRTGEGKTLVATCLRTSTRSRARASTWYGERLPRQARRRVDGPHPPLPRAHGGRGRAADGLGREAGVLPVGHHVRHQQRIRLRLPARQHGDPGVGALPARAPLRDRGRGGLDPHRRGAHPLIISGQAEDSTELYRRINVLVPKLTKQEKEDSPGDYFVDLKQHQVTLSEAGHEHAEELMSEAGLLPGGSEPLRPSNIVLMHHMYAGIRAHALYHRDQHYVVMNDEIVIVDEFTGRMMQGRRWSDGLHQAVEAKERVSIKNESQTLASITFQNYFRLYKKLAGMTGTADTEAFEFSSIYNLETVLIPTHRTWCART
jgi:preprotein translocase subunit SecA